MSFPIRHLPILQNWDCHARGTCCKEYVVTITREEKERIEAQGWDQEKDLGGLRPFVRAGLPWARRYQLNHREDGSCVFLSEEGRCRIHERHGYESKPLPCRMFPFVLVPQGDCWGVSIRFACPSAAANLGRPMTEHTRELAEFAEEIAIRAGLTPRPDGNLIRPPRLQGRQRVDWPETRQFLDALMTLLRNRRDRIERRFRKCLSLSAQSRQAPTIHELKGPALQELLSLFLSFTDAETPVDPAAVPRPTWVGRVLFRQLLAVYTRKDHGPNRGVVAKGRLALVGSAIRFVRGKGRVPRMHAWLPETTFEKIEESASPLTPAAEDVLERYYLMKVGSMQFCGSTSFNMSLWEGFEALALTLPILLWVTRAFAPMPAEEAVTKALSIVDDHFGFNRVLGTLRQRFGMRILSRRGETTRLIAHYSR
jgi:lysine-N-methylase